VLTGLEQQRDGEDGVGAGGLCQAPPASRRECGGAGCFEALACAGIIEHQAAQGGAVQVAVGVDQSSPKAAAMCER
jgi:hypothetical protein